jgi:hypothetical protein
MNSKGSEENGHGPIKIISQRLLGETEKHHEKPQ